MRGHWYSLELVARITTEGKHETQGDRQCILAWMHTAPILSLTLFLSGLLSHVVFWGDQGSLGHPDTGMLHSCRLIHSGRVEIQQPRMHGFAAGPGTCLILLGFHKE